MEEKEKERMLQEKKKNRKVPGICIIKVGLFKGNYRRNVTEAKEINSIVRS